jgi:hypothetical protein
MKRINRNQQRTVAHFPLPLALSLGERANRPPQVGKSGCVDCRKIVRKQRSIRLLFPLPEGEGQGEGRATVRCWALDVGCWMFPSVAA